MADIVNLRRARKAQKKQAKEEAAQANRVAFGRTKAEKKLSSALKSMQEKGLDGQKLTGPAKKPES